MNSHIGRQAIYNKNLEIIGYELLYRNSNNNFYPASVDEDIATYDLINIAALQSPLSNKVDNQYAFINFTENCILGNAYEKFNSNDIKNHIVIELLETINITPNIIEKIKDIKSKGFTLALDDFIYSEEYNNILPYIDIIKIDIFQKSKISYIDLKNKILSINRNIKFLAEKIETKDDFDLFLSLNFDYFQGYFFSKPEVIELNWSE